MIVTCKLMISIIFSLKHTKASYFWLYKHNSMKKLKTELLVILSELKGSGKFATSGNQDFIIPGLVIN